MNFILEEIDLAKVKQLYFLRGYKNKGDDHYMLSFVLVGDENQDFEACLFLSQKTITVTEWKQLLKYLKKTGMKIHAKTLKADADKFYNARAFRRVNVSEGG